jgi:hypothetical protein
VKERLATLGYLLATLLVVLPLLDLLANIWPWSPGEVSWRYGSFTLLSGFLLTPLMGLALAVGVAVAAGDPRVARILGAVGLASAILLLAGAVIFALDVVSIGATVPPEASTTFTIGAGKALLKCTVMAAALAWIGAMGWASGGRSWDLADPRRSDESPVIGR